MEKKRKEKKRSEIKDRKKREEEKKRTCEDCLRDELDKVLENEHLYHDENACRRASEPHRAAFFQDQHRSDRRLCTRQAAKESDERVREALREQLLPLVRHFVALISLLDELIHDE